MSQTQTACIIILALAAAGRLLFFDKRGKTHKPVAALIAYVSIIWLGSLATAAVSRLHSLTVWLLIFGLALHTGSIIYTRGNISKINPKKEKLNV